MPGPRRVSRGTRGKTQRRKSVWARSSTSQTLGAGASFAVNLLQGFETDYGANLIGCTVVRIRGQVLAAVTTASAAVDELRMGIRVATATEVSAALAGPVDEAHADWMAWEPFLASGVGTDNGSWAAVREIDVKAMRRLDEIDMQLTAYVESFSPAAWEFGWSLSVLLLLP